MRFVPVFLIFLLNISQVFVLDDGKLTKYKTEFHKIGFDVENFVFDIAKEVFQNGDIFFNGDYDEYSNEDNKPEEKARLSNAIEKESSKSEEFKLSSSEIDELQRKKRNIDYTYQEDEPYSSAENYVGAEYNDFQEQPYMQADNFVGAERNENNMFDNQHLEPYMPMDTNVVGAPQPDKTADDIPICSKRAQDEKILEDQHLGDIKGELKKLYELVAILKDQQKILSMLDKDNKQMNREIPDEHNNQDLLKVLENLNNNHLNEVADETRSLPTHKELESLKLDLRKAIASLNDTKNNLNNDKGKEFALEHEIKQQQEQIDFLNVLVEKLLSKQTDAVPKQFQNEKNVHPTAEKLHGSQINDKLIEKTLPESQHFKKAKNDAEVVGAPLFLPKNLPLLRPHKDNTDSINKTPNNVKDASIVNFIDSLTPEARTKYDEKNRFLPHPYQVTENKKEALSMSNRKIETNIKDPDSKIKTTVQNTKDNSKDLPETNKKGLAEQTLNSKDKFDTNPSGEVNKKTTNNKKDLIVPDPKSKDGKEKHLIDPIPESDARFSNKENSKFTNKEAHHNTKARVNDLSELFDDLMDKPKKHDLLSEIRELEDKLEIQNRQENMKKELLILRRLMGLEATSRMLPEDDFLKKLQTLIKTADMAKLQGKSGDTEDELKKLESAINTLRPNGEVDLLDFPFSKGQAINNDASVILSTHQIMELRKKLDDIIKTQAKSDKNIPNIDGSSYSLDSKKGSYKKPSRHMGPYTPVSSLPPPSSLDYSFPPSYPPYFNPFFYQPLPYMPPDYGSYGPVPAYSQASSMGPTPYPQVSPFGSQPYPQVSPYGPAPYYAQQSLNGPQPYSQAPSSVDQDAYSQIYPEADGKNQFFQAPQQFLPHRYFNEFNNVKEGFTGYIPHQPDENTSNGNFNVDSKTKVIQDLKTELNTLESEIAKLNSPTYNNKYQDQATLNLLKQEVHQLKTIINSLTRDKYIPNPSTPQEVPTPAPETSYSQQHYRPISQTRYKRSIDNNENINKISTEQKPSESVKEFDDLTTKFRDYLMEEEKTAVEEQNSNARTVELNDIRQRLNNLKFQLGNTPLTRDDGYSKPFEYLQKEIYNNPLYVDYNKNLLNIIKKPLLPTSLFVPPKKVDIFSDIVLKIIDKVIKLVPVIVGKLFGEGFEGLLEKVTLEKDAYYDSYGKQYKGYGSPSDVSYNDKSSLVSVFYGLGAFGYIPLIILKVLNCISTFVSVLKKNKFFKNFLVPALVLALVAGAVIFLTWWLKEDDQNDASVRLLGFDNQLGGHNEFNRKRPGYTGTVYNEYKQGYNHIHKAGYNIGQENYKNEMPEYTRADKNRVAYGGPDYYNHHKSGTGYYNYYQQIPYPMNSYGNSYPSSYLPYSNSKGTNKNLNNLSNMVPRPYFRTYFDHGSNTK